MRYPAPLLPALLGAVLAFAPVAAGQEAAGLLQDGLTKLKAKDHRGAIASLTAALKADPTLYAAHLARGQARSGRSDHEGALSDYLKALGLAGKARKAVRSGLLNADGHRPARLAALTALILFDLADWEAYRARAQVQLEAGQLARARSDYDKLVARGGGLLDDRLARASCMFLQGQRKEARAASEEALAQAKGKPEAEAKALTLRADFRRQMGDVTGARADYDRAIQLAPKLGSAYLGRGMARTTDLAGSIQDLTTAHGLGEAQALHERGLTHLAQGASKEALADFTAHLARAPKAVPTYLERGRLHLRLNDPAAARVDVDRVFAILKSTPHRLLRANALLLRARIRIATRDYRNALADLDRAIQFGPRLARARIQRARIKNDLGDAAGAGRDATVAIRLNPKQPTAWALRAEAQFLVGSTQAALNDWNRAFKLARNRVQPGWLILRARASRSLGQVKRALSDLDLAVRSPGRSDPWFHRGLTRLLAGDRPGALADLRTSATKRGNGSAVAWLGALGQADESLQKIAARPGWAGDVARCLLGKTTTMALLAAAQQAKQPLLQQMRMADAHCLIGLRLEAKGDRAGATRHYQACLATRRPNAVSWQWVSDRLRIQQLRQARARQPKATPPKAPTPPSKEPY